MPFLRVLTNAEITGGSDQFAEKAAQLVASELGKSISFVVVTVKQNRTMSFGGKIDNYGVLAYMDSIGFGNHKASLANKLTDFFLENIPTADRGNINIVFKDMPPSDVAIGGNLMG